MPGTEPPFAARTTWNLEPNRLARAVDRRRAAGKPLIDLTESNPTRCGFVLDGLRLDAPLYEPDPRGLPEARRAVAACYPGVAPEHIVLTSSSSEAYSHLFRLLADPGDRVLAPAPSYPLFEFLARLNDVELAEYRLEFHGRWEIDFASLEAAAGSRTRTVIVVHPNNPTGSFVTPAEREELVAFCRRRGLALLADEVFLEYPLGPGAATFAGEDRILTFAFNGLSKSAALPQMKLGWIAVSGPSAWRDDALGRLEVIADTYLSVASPIQRALPGLLGRRGEIQQRVRARLAANLGRLDAVLVAQSVCSRLPVEGGWSVVLRVPSVRSDEVRSDEDWAVELVERDGVLVHPGHFFSFASEGYLVASLLAPEEAFAEGIGRVAARMLA